MNSIITLQTEEWPSVAIKIARDWLKKDYEKWFGPANQWSQEKTDRFYTELGVLSRFVTDCWPKN